jgi:myosin V
MSRNRGNASNQKTYYWCPHQEKVWIAGELLNEKGTNVEVLLVDEQKRQTFPKDNCLKMEDESVMTEEANDLISLSHVNDATILNSSRLRFNRKVIYTSIGAVLMAINPFETIPGLYGSERIEQYCRLSDDSLPAHVYMIPSRAYSAMCSFGKSQSLLISGESGAGKTEATKQCLDFLTKVSSSGAHGSNGQASDIASRIIAASPILEAFGNAQTIRNPNSSRFGKWMELLFSNDNTILGSKITSYLLEVRICICIQI